MNSVSIVRDRVPSARASFMTLLLAILLLVTGCASGENQRVALAPPPPLGNIPYDVAMSQSMNDIQPAAGTENEPFGPGRRLCAVRTSFYQGESRLGFGHEAGPRQDEELSFSRMLSTSSTPVMIRLSVPLRSLVKERACP
jgi:hypothetical protein